MMSRFHFFIANITSHHNPNQSIYVFKVSEKLSSENLQMKALFVVCSTKYVPLIIPFCIIRTLTVIM
jgi:hypothetical protein